MNNIELRNRVLDAFKELRKRRITARGNFSCCTTCASYELAVAAQKGNRIGYVYWHRQDEAQFRGAGQLHLGFGAVGVYDDHEVGRLIVEALEEKSVPVFWSGDALQKIKVGGQG